MLKDSWLFRMAGIISIIFILTNAVGFKYVEIGKGIRFHFVSTTSSSPATYGDNYFIATATHNDFSEQTRAIINQQWATENMNEDNYKQILAKYGGYNGWVKHLGGVFAQYAGKDCVVQVNSVEDLQVAAEYTWGLMTIIGFDYDSDKHKFHKWGADNKEIRQYSFYTNPNRGWLAHMYESAPIDEICSASGSAIKSKAGGWVGMRTNCNCGLDSFMKKTSLYEAKKINKKTVIKNLEYPKIKVGDIIDFYGYSNSDDEPNRWHHDAIVGEIAENGDIIMYDAGNRFIRTGKFKKVLQKDYKSYRWYKVTHFIDLEPTTRLGSAATTSTEASTTTTNGLSWKVDLKKLPIQLPSFIAKIFGGKTAVSFSANSADEKYAAIVNVMEEWNSMDGKDAHSEVIDAYNSYQDAHGKSNHHMKSNLSDRKWCSETAAAAYAKAGYGDLIGGMSSNVGSYEDHFDAASCKIDKNATPKPGWIVCYGGGSGHTAIIISVSDDGKKLQCLAGGTSKIHHTTVSKRDVKFYGAPFEESSK